MKPVVIVAAVNGGYQMSSDITHVPYSPLEIAIEAARCREAGAAVVHFHARDEDGITTGEIEVFRETIRLIREHSDILIQTTNGIGARLNKATGEWIRPTEEDRVALLNLDPRPDLFGAATGSTDFTHPWGGQPVDRPFINNRDWLMASIRNAHSKNSTVEFEVVHTPALYRLHTMATEEGVFDPNADYLWLLHGAGIAHFPPIPRLVIQSIEEGRALFPNAKVGILGCGPHQFPIAAVGLAADCDTVRTGLEDNLFQANGELATSTSQLVGQMSDLAKFFRRRPATPAEAREILGLNRNSVAQAA